MFGAIEPSAATLLASTIEPSAATLLARELSQPPLPLWVTGLSGLLAAAGLCLRPVRLLGCGLLGFAVAQAALYAHGAAVQRVDERLLVQARIVSIAQVSGLATRFDAQLQFPRDPQRPGLRARISWPGAGGRAVHAGERWQLLLRLRPPQATLNFEGVDTERNLLRDRIQALGTVIVSPLDQREAPAPPYSLLALRERLAHHISGAVDDAADALASRRHTNAARSKRSVGSMAAWKCTLARTHWRTPAHW